MKNKKIWLLLSLSCILSGILLTAVGILLGGIPGFYVGKTGVHTSREHAARTMEVLQNAMELEAFDSVELSVNYTDVMFVPSDRYAVDYRITGTGGAPVCQVENGRLIFQDAPMDSEPRIWFLYAGPTSEFIREPGPYYVKIEFPADCTFSEVSARMESGDLELPDLRADTLKIRNEYGNVTLNGYSGRELELHMSTGTLSLDTIHAEKSSIENEYGNILIGQASGEKFTADLSSGSFFADRLDFADLIVENEYGTVQFGLPESTAPCGYRLFTEYGFIRMDGAMLGGREDEDGAEYVSEGDGTKMITVSCESGDIVIDTF